DSYPERLFRAAYGPRPGVHFTSELFPRLLAEAGLSTDWAIAQVGHPIIQAWMLAPGEPDVATLWVAFLGPRDPPPSHERRWQLGGVGAPLRSAIRLRHRPAAGALPDDPATEAVFTPDGRLLDARGEAWSRPRRERLAQSVREIEWARGRPRRDDPR